MPSKIQLDENLWFLYICLQKSDLKAIDFNAVGLATSLKPPAARMRYTRLKRQIESGALNAAHGPEPSSSSPPSSTSPNIQSKSTPHPAPKRRRVIKSVDSTPTPTPASASAQNPTTKRETGLDNSEKEREKPAPSPKTTPRVLFTDPTPEFKTEKIAERAKEQKDTKIKVEDYSSSDTDFNSGSEDDEDSEDEMPLAKLRKRRGLALGMGAMDTDGSSGYGYGCETGPATVYSTYAASREGYLGPRTGMGNGNESVAESTRHVPQGFNTMATGSGNGGGGSGRVEVGGFGGNAGQGRGRNGGIRGVYASPYAGWIDGWSHEDQMGAPGPGWEHYARYQGQNHHQQQEQQQQQQRQHQEFEQSQIGGSEGPKESV
ncbi:hypothetical protein ACEPPN_003727 [Leptodophora sp. 'Broadleaf-Isolate-01']